MSGVLPWVATLLLGVLSPSSLFWWDTSDVTRRSKRSIWLCISSTCLVEMADCLVFLEIVKRHARGSFRTMQFWHGCCRLHFNLASHQPCSYKILGHLYFLDRHGPQERGTRAFLPVLESWLFAFNSSGVTNPRLGFSMLKQSAVGVLVQKFYVMMVVSRSQGHVLRTYPRICTSDYDILVTCRNFSADFVIPER